MGFDNLNITAIIKIAAFYCGKRTKIILIRPLKLTDRVINNELFKIQYSINFHYNSFSYPSILGVANS